MTESEIIKSTTNQHVKYLRKILSDKNFRKQEGVFAAEGKSLGFDISSNCDIDERKLKSGVRKVYFDKRIFDSVSDSVNPSGITALVKMKKEKFDNGDVIVLDGISDPGNLGTIIRTAAALGIANILACHTTDAYSPKSVRSSMGGIFHTNIIEADIDEAKKILNDYEVFSLDMNGENIFQCSFRENKKTALIVGNEAHGVSEEFLKISDKILSLPMSGKIESLNAAVSVSVAAYVYKFFKR